MKTKPTSVLFRRDKYGALAVFLDDYHPSFFDLAGWRGPYCRDWCFPTQPATPAECRRLRAALKARGYGPLKVLKRWPRAAAKGGAR